MMMPNRNLLEYLLNPARLLAVCCMLLAATSSAQDQQNAVALVDTVNDNWRVEVIVFMQARPDEAFRDRMDIDDYRDLPALAARLTAASPIQPLAGPSLNSQAGEPLPATSSMADAWRRLERDYQRIAYFYWQQPAGRGGLRRIHNDQPLRVDDSLSLGPHYELDGSLRISTGTIGYARLELVQRTPLLITPAAGSTANAGVERLWRTLKLAQQRRIQPGRVEYFDSAGLAALILITPPEAVAQADDEDN